MFIEWTPWIFSCIFHLKIKAKNMLILSSTCLSTESWLSSCLMQAIMLGTEDAEHQHFFIVAMATLAQVWERCLSMKKKKKRKKFMRNCPMRLADIQLQETFFSSKCLEVRDYEPLRIYNRMLNQR